MLNRLPTQLPPLWMLVDDIGRPSPRQLAKSLDVTERTVERWLKTDKAPRPVMFALFWLTRWGQHAVHCEAHNVIAEHVIEVLDLVGLGSDAQVVGGDVLAYRAAGPDVCHRETIGHR